MIRAFFLSVGQLGDPAIIRVFLKSLALTLLVLATVGAGIWWVAKLGVEALAVSSSGQIAGVLTAVAMVFIGWLLFRVIAIGVIGIFADEVVVAVERRHYPEALGAARDIGLSQSIALGLGSAVRAVLVNLALIPVYVALLVTGVGTAALFFVVNGWLLGRDLGDMVAVRHVARAGLPEWRRGTRFSRFTLGLIETGLFIIPVINLAAPILGAAMATHWFHRGRGA